jgi:hypothetical protein
MVLGKTRNSHSESLFVAIRTDDRKHVQCLWNWRSLAPGLFTQQLEQTSDNSDQRNLRGITVSNCCYVRSRKLRITAEGDSPR